MGYIDLCQFRGIVNRALGQLDLEARAQRLAKEAS
jgi:hypothetical protein